MLIYVTMKIICKRAPNMQASNSAMKKKSHKFWCIMQMCAVACTSNVVNFLSHIAFVSFASCKISYIEGFLLFFVVPFFCHTEWCIAQATEKLGEAHYIWASVMWTKVNGNDLFIEWMNFGIPYGRNVSTQKRKCTKNDKHIFLFIEQCII